MNEKVKIINALSEHLTDKQVGMLTKQARLEKKLEEEVLMGISDAFYGRMAKLSQKIGAEAQQKMMDMIEEDCPETEVIVEVIKITFSVLDRMKDLEGYEEYEILATEVYRKYDIDFNELQGTTKKMRELLNREEIAEKVFEELD